MSVPLPLATTGSTVIPVAGPASAKDDEGETMKCSYGHRHSRGGSVEAEAPANHVNFTRTGARYVRVHGRLRSQVAGNNLGVLMMAAEQPDPPSGRRCSATISVRRLDQTINGLLEVIS